jgi:hypothetical protein
MDIACLPLPRPDALQTLEIAGISKSRQWAGPRGSLARTGRWERSWKSETEAASFLQSPAKDRQNVLCSGGRLAATLNRLPNPNYASKWGSIVYDVEADPGTASEAQIVLQPGQYLALSGEGEGKVKLRASFTVTAAPSPAALPVAQATEQAIDFAFRGPSTDGGRGDGSFHTAWR